MKKIRGIFMSKCAVVVVTYNRKKLLEENLAALRNQTYKHYSIFVIDNASTDGTEEFVKSIKDDKILYFNTGKNLGGAGGFTFGLREVAKRDYQYAWIMDDDSIPKENALESLMEKAEKINDAFSYMASLVYWTNNELFNMNIPTVKYKTKMDVRFDLASKYKIMPIETSSFVGCFINMEAVKKVGLPISEFFIYGDDVEYTMRLKKYAPAYLDLDSIIVHKAPSNKGADIATADKSRISRFYYQSRNGVYISRKNGKRLKRLKTIVVRIVKIIMRASDNKGKRIWVLLKGSCAGMIFNPKIEYVKKTEKVEDKR